MSQRSTRNHLAVAALLAGIGGIPALCNAQIKFDPPVTYPSGDAIWSITAGDFNRDKIPDLATGGWANGEVFIHLNNGDGTFAPGVVHDVGVNVVGGIAAADFNNDGWDDLATSNLDWNNVSVLLNNQDGTFAPPVLYPVGNRVWNVEAGDLNNDGWQDLVTANVLTGDISVLLNNQDGTFAPAVSYPTDLSTLDITIALLDDDEFADIASAHYSYNKFSVLLNNGDGTFAPRTSYTVGSGSRGVVAVDLDRDGDNDLVTANSLAENITILTNNGAGQFPRINSLAVGFSCYQVAVGDVDLDHDPDIFVALHDSPPNVAVFKNRGDGTLADEVLFPTGPNTGPVDLVVADFDLDGRPDFAVGNLSYDSFTVRLNRTAYPPVLTQEPLVRGNPAKFTVTGAFSNEKVFFAYSTRGVAPDGSCLPALGGMCLDLKTPAKLLGARRANGSGIAELTVTIPLNTPPITIWTQAAIIRGPGGADSVKSNYLENVVQ